MTWELKGLVVGPPNEAIFDIPAPYGFRTCQRNIGGFPYLHLFHHHLRF
jgi:hypothetical protein